MSEEEQVFARQFLESMGMTDPSQEQIFAAIFALKHADKESGGAEMAAEEYFWAMDNDEWAAVPGPLFIASKFIKKQRSGRTSRMTDFELSQVPAVAAQLPPRERALVDEYCRADYGLTLAEIAARSGEPPPPTDDRRDRDRRDRRDRREREEPGIGDLIKMVAAGLGGNLRLAQLLAGILAKTLVAIPPLPKAAKYARVDPAVAGVADLLSTPGVRPLLTALGYRDDTTGVGMTWGGDVALLANVVAQLGPLLIAPVAAAGEAAAARGAPDGTPVVDAVLRGDVEAVRALVAGGVRCDTTVSLPALPPMSALTAIITLLSHRSPIPAEPVPALEVLLKAGPADTPVAGNGVGLLLLVVGMPFPIAYVDAALAAGLSPTEICEGAGGVSALHVAAGDAERDVEVLQRLLATGCDVDVASASKGTPFELATLQAVQQPPGSAGRERALRRIHALLERRPKFVVPRPAGGRGGAPQMPPMLALAALGDGKTMRMALDKGTGVPDENVGDSPLVLLAVSLVCESEVDAITFVQALADYGYDVHRADASGDCAMAVARDRNFRTLAALLERCYASAKVPIPPLPPPPRDVPEGTPLEVGDWVTVRPGVTPTWGWGLVQPGEQGRIAKVMSEEGLDVAVVRFPRVRGWRGLLSELQRVLPS